MSSDDGYGRLRGGLLSKFLFLVVAVGAGAFGALAISRGDLLGGKSDKDDTIKTEDVAPKID